MTTGKDRYCEWGRVWLRYDRELWIAGEGMSILGENCCCGRIQPRAARASVFVREA